MDETVRISDLFDLGNKVVVTFNATRRQRQAIAHGADVWLGSSSGRPSFDRIQDYGSIDRSDFLSGPDLKNIGLSFEQLTGLNQVPHDATVTIRIKDGVIANGLVSE